MRKRLLIFGGSGFIGGNLAKIAQEKGWKVSISSSNNKPENTVEWLKVDITDKNEVDNIIKRIDPDVVVNLAAVANIDIAEKDKESAWKVNVEGAKYIAESCSKQNIKYIFFSSDAVFDGKKDMYYEDDFLNPINYYGRTKAEAERAVIETCSSAMIIRVSTVIGFNINGGKSFLGQLKMNLSEGKEVVCPIYELRTPIDVITLSKAVIELAQSEFSGILHIGSTDSVNRYELTRRAAEFMGYDTKLIKARLEVENVSNLVPRHRNGVINVSKAQDLLNTKFLNVDESIKRLIRK